MCKKSHSKAQENPFNAQVNSFKIQENLSMYKETLSKTYEFTVRGPLFFFQIVGRAVSDATEE